MRAKSSVREAPKVVNLLKGSAPSVDRAKVTVLVDDSASKNRPRLKAKHGLSLLVETSMTGLRARMLMDTGPPPDIALSNARVMHAHVDEVDAIIISHGHYDHIGGLLEILRLGNRRIPVIAHPRVFAPKLTYRPNLRFIGAHFDEQSVEASGGVLVLASNPVKIAPGVATSGEISRENDFEKTDGFWTIEDGLFVEDSINDDQALLINVKDKGLVVVTGCAHSGIINTIRQSQKTSGVEELYAVVGGIHLEKSADTRIEQTLDELSRFNPNLIYPCHCTGTKATHQILERFGQRCRPILTGDSFEI